MCTHIRGTQVNSIKKLNVVLGHLQNFKYSADKSDLLRAKSVFSPKGMYWKRETC